MKTLKKMALAAAGLFAALATGVSSAALSVQDLSAMGDGLLTVDSQSGLAWLDVSATFVTGIAPINLDTSAWEARGFRRATAVELSQLIVHATSQDAPFVTWLGGIDISRVTSILGWPTQSLLGVVADKYVDGIPLGSGGLLITESHLTADDPYRQVMLTEWPEHFDEATSQAAYQALLARGEAPMLRYGSQVVVRAGAVAAPFGAFLVKDVSAVPEPGSLGLMAGGLLAMCGAALARRGSRAYQAG